MSNEESEFLRAINLYYDKLTKEAAAAGYYLNPDVQFTKTLIAGLVANAKRYGYASCPCRLAAEKKEKDLDIICPCDYRDLDLAEYGTCYCALYVSEAVLKGKRNVSPIPERRPPLEKWEASKTLPSQTALEGLAYPVWRCKVCGYLCARETPPDMCPICKAKKERFERFI